MTSFVVRTLEHCNLKTDLIVNIVYVWAMSNSFSLKLVQIKLLAVLEPWNSQKSRIQNTKVWPKLKFHYIGRALLDFEHCIGSLSERRQLELEHLFHRILRRYPVLKSFGLSKTKPRLDLNDLFKLRIFNDSIYQNSSLSIHYFWICLVSKYSALSLVIPQN